MEMYTTKGDFRHDEMSSMGVLVANLGTPDEPTTPALRRYLEEFLRDPRVIERPAWKWWPILYGIILRTRPRKSAAAYREVWTEAGSPLLRIGQRQAAGVKSRMEARATSGPFAVELGMRYGRPSIAEALQRLRDAGARRIVVLPLYPQYAASTTGSTWDAVAAELTRWRWVPELRFIGHYHDDPSYIEALAASIREHWAAHGRGERLLFSFHGIPRRYFDDGDPYFCHCQKTARLVAEKLGVRPAGWAVSFQSRFGREEWLQPYTDETVRRLAKEEGVKRLDVVCPGFAADCLETLEEIAGENAEYFEQAGGDHLAYIPALNDRPDHLDALAKIVLRHAQGWPEVAPYRVWDDERRFLAETAERARQMGAEF